MQTDGENGCRGYEKGFVAGWGDMDFNAHMRNTAFLDKAADVRMMFFAENGFAMEAFSRLRVGPVVMKDEIEYHREIALLEPIRVTLALAGLAEDGSRFRLRNCFYLTGEALSARVTSDGGWMDLERRRLVAPPAALLTVLRILPRTDDFEVLATSLR